MCVWITLQCAQTFETSRVTHHYLFIIYCFQFDAGVRRARIRRARLPPARSPRARRLGRSMSSVAVLLLCALARARAQCLVDEIFSLETLSSLIGPGHDVCSNATCQAIWAADFGEKATAMTGDTLGTYDNLGMQASTCACRGAGQLTQDGISYVANLAAMQAICADEPCRDEVLSGNAVNSGYTTYLIGLAASDFDWNTDFVRMKTALTACSCAMAGAGWYWGARGRRRLLAPRRCLPWSPSPAPRPVRSPLAHSCLRAALTRPSPAPASSVFGIDDTTSPGIGAAFCAQEACTDVGAHCIRPELHATAPSTSKARSSHSSRAQILPLLARRSFSTWHTASECPTFPPPTRATPSR
jgi:hypothetical protein